MRLWRAIIGIGLLAALLGSGCQNPGRQIARFYGYRGETVAPPCLPGSLAEKWCALQQQGGR